jgi:uroporphyrinogen-III decarboxylase
MEREFYLQLAAAGLRMPIGTDLVLHEQPEGKGALLSGEKLARVIETAARRFKTPLALAHMDLEVEKEAMLAVFGISHEQAATYHFEEPPTWEQINSLASRVESSPTGRLKAQIEAVSLTAAHPDLVNVAMCIGPFSLMTKLLSDPITPVCLAGSGITGEEDAEVLRMERTLELAYQMVEWSIRAKIRAGARAVCIAEPAANKVFLSPRQLEKGSDIFERFVMRHHRKLRQMLEDSHVDLIFHCCGELVPSMVKNFAELDPAILSLGSSRNLWEDAALVSPRTVLFGNLPSKRFYSDELTVEAVAEQARNLDARMKGVGHPFILGSECDVLSVPGREKVIA